MSMWSVRIDMYLNQSILLSSMMNAPRECHTIGYLALTSKIGDGHINVTPLFSSEMLVEKYAVSLAISK